MAVFFLILTKEIENKRQQKIIKIAPGTLVVNVTLKQAQQY